MPVASLAERLPGPILMGIVNVTPDSFSDGGRFDDPEAATAHGLALAGEGAAIVDVGGESTRPGSDGIATADELSRIVPVIRALRAASPVAISIDTTKSAVASAALAAGATMVNDISALRNDPRMAAVVADAGADLCLMHMQGTPRTMQDDPRYEDVVREVGAALAAQVEVAVAAGVSVERICVDPGIGFGKTVEHNCTLLAGLGELRDRLGLPILVGASRKGFLGRLIGDLERDRLAASLAAGLAAITRGAWGLRVHDVRAHADALAIWRSVR